MTSAVLLLTLSCPAGIHPLQAAPTITPLVCGAWGEKRGLPRPSTPLDRFFDFLHGRNTSNSASLQDLQARSVPLPAPQPAIPPAAMPPAPPPVAFPTPEPVAYPGYQAAPVSAQSGPSGQMYYPGP